MKSDNVALIVTQYLLYMWKHVTIYHRWCLVWTHKHTPGAIAGPHTGQELNLVVDLFQWIAFNECKLYSDPFDIIKTFKLNAAPLSE